MEKRITKHKEVASRIFQYRYKRHPKNIEFNNLIKFLVVGGMKESDAIDYVNELEFGKA